MSLAVIFVSFSVSFWLVAEVTMLLADFVCGHLHSSPGFNCQLVGNIPLYLGIICSAIIAITNRTNASYIAILIPVLAVAVKLAVSSYGEDGTYEWFRAELHYHIVAYSIPFALVVSIILYVYRASESEKA